MAIAQATHVIDYELATSSRRIAGRLVDILAVFILLFLTGLLLGLIDWALGQAGVDRRAAGNILGVAFLLGLSLIQIGYDAIAIRRFGKTVGMKITGLCVVDSRGARLGWGWSIARAFLLYVSLIVAWLLFFFSATILGWIYIQKMNDFARYPHDRLSKSFVVREVHGQLKPAAAKPSPFAELERLRSDGIISQEEYERKRQQLKF